MPETMPSDPPPSTRSVLLQVQVHDEPPAAVREAVDAGLHEHNLAHSPLHQVRPLACSLVADDGGTVIAGCTGRTWGRCAELQMLWVAPAQRGHGLGAQLVRAFEAAARARGCDTFYLETWSFQAPAFYRRLGYAVWLELAGFAPGVVKYTMLRQDTPTALPPQAMADSEADPPADQRSAR